LYDLLCEAEEVHQQHVNIPLPLVTRPTAGESVKTYEGTHEMHTLIIGEDITGIPSFRVDYKD